MNGIDENGHKFTWTQDICRVLSPVTASEPFASTVFVRQGVEVSQYENDTEAAAMAPKNTNTRFLDDWIKNGRETI